jgi:carbonic anhydrase
MANILNLQVKDETLKNVISNNPFYVDIKGSVNICLIRCGQEIEKCNSVNFSTMTNYGKILVLNPDKSKLSKCNIKLAFDNTNDTLNEKGESNYKFENAFFTVPSLHKLNGQIFDMETFLLFSSIQKNGTTLYVCLCIFNTGTNVVQNGDPKLLNFKLLNELFSKNNSVPDMYGTNPINGIPNPVDISNFIPEEGSRNFYDYTHPSNTKVNFRIFQTPMYVSNDIITILKSKLTPGNIYTNFRDYINKSINPSEGLFFYFSEDLTNRYKSYKSNTTNSNESNNKNKDKFENISDSIIEEQELYENEENFKKLEIKKNIINEEDEIDDDDEIKKDDDKKDDNKKSESFSSEQKHESNQSITIIIFIVSFILIVNFLYTIFINNFFTAGKNIDENDLPNYLSEMLNENMKSILCTKFKSYSILLWQVIITFFVIIFLIIYISNNNTEQSIYKSILIFLFLIFVNGIISFILNIKYFIYRLKNIFDDDFSQKENYLFSYILNKSIQGNVFTNIISILKEDFTSFVQLHIQQNLQQNIQSGGEKSSDTVNELGNKSGNENNIYYNKLVPGPSTNEKTLQFYKHKDILDKVSFFNFYKLFDPDILSIIYEKFKNNKSWTINSYILIFIIILFFIIGFLFQLKYISIGNNILLKTIVSLIVIAFLYLPVALCIISFGYFYAIDYKIQLAVIFLTIIGIFLALFIPGGIAGNKKKNWINNIPFWFCICFFAISILLIIVGKFTRKNVINIKTPPKGGNNIPQFNINLQEPSSPPVNDYYVLKEQLDESEEKKILYQKELENIYSKKEGTEQDINKNTEQDTEQDTKQDTEQDNYIKTIENEILLLKDKLNSYKEKSILYNKYYEYSIDDLKKNIESIIENTKLYKLNTVATNLSFVLELVDKLKYIEQNKSDKEYNQKILEILNKLINFNPKEDLNNDIKKLNNIKLDKNIQTAINNITSKIKDVTNIIKLKINEIKKNKRNVNIK